MWHISVFEEGEMTDKEKDQSAGYQSMMDLMRGCMARETEACDCGDFDCGDMMYSPQASDHHLPHPGTLPCVPVPGHCQYRTDPTTSSSFIIRGC